MDQLAPTEVQTQSEGWGAGSGLVTAQCRGNFAKSITGGSRAWWRTAGISPSCAWRFPEKAWPGQVSEGGAVWEGRQPWGRQGNGGGDGGMFGE